MQTNKQICLVCSARETAVVISQLLTQLPGLFLSAVFSSIGGALCGRFANT